MPDESVRWTAAASVGRRCVALAVIIGVQEEEEDE
jgi:hypothetical protein